MPARKKDSSVRARRNRAASRATLAQVVRDVPVMPPAPTGTGWHGETASWWKDVWSSPMSAEWDESDRHNVALCALLFNDIWTAETASERKGAAAEYRLQRQSLGLSPYDRRRLEWTIETAEEASERGRKRRSQSAPQPPAEGDDDPRSVLSIAR